jgi:hypothetical protein
MPQYRFIGQLLRCANTSVIDSLAEGGVTLSLSVRSWPEEYQSKDMKIPQGPLRHSSTRPPITS